MARTLVAPIHNPGHPTQSKTQPSLDDLQAAFDECTRNVSLEDIRQIKAGQISLRKLSSSPKLRRAFETWQKIADRQS